MKAENDDNKAIHASTPVIISAELKALGDGRVGGYLVRFTSKDEPDLENEYFDAKSDLDLESGDNVSIYYNHGLDPLLKNRRLGRAPVKLDDSGAWLEYQLNLRDEYESAIYQMAESGKMGWSSGPAQHLVRKQFAGKAWHITHWPIKEASLTPTPAEFRNSATPIKSFCVATYGDLCTTSTLLVAKQAAVDLPEVQPEALDGAADTVNSDLLLIESLLALMEE